MNNTLVISQDWDFTRTREKGGETFAFHSAGTCPGYSITISGWRLRKIPGAQITQDELFLRGLDELNCHLGGSVCPGRKGLETLKTKVKEKMFPPGGLMPPDWTSKTAAGNQKAYEQEFLIELRRILFSPRVARLSVPLLTLIIRDSAEYRLDKEPWSHGGPPRELRHLAASGFDSQCPLGILARPPTGKYLWIVSKFKECAIELKWNRRAAIEAEYPLMMPIEDLKSIIVSGNTEILSALRSKNVPPVQLGSPPPAKTEPYVFKRVRNNGDVWQIVFKGQELAPIRHLAGLTYLHELLAHPGHHVSAMTLHRLENLPPPEEVAPVNGEALDSGARKWYGTGGTAQRVMQGLSPEKLRACKAALEAKLEKEDLSNKQREGIEEQIEMFEKALTTARVARTTGGATFPNEAKRPRQAVAGAINRALKAIAKKKPHGKSIAKYLDGKVNRGTTLFYNGDLTWQT